MYTIVYMGNKYPLHSPLCLDTRCTVRNGKGKAMCAHKWETEKGNVCPRIEKQKGQCVPTNEKCWRAMRAQEMRKVAMNGDDNNNY